jgi:type IX secretion system PorP/SprF family membrane protein
VCAVAQDIHFSNFFSNSLNLNPAMSGAIKGSWRFNLTARDQYRTVAVPYKTFSFGVDTRLHNPHSGIPPLGVGLLIDYDLAGDAYYSATQLLLPVALHFPINQFTISPAIMPGIGFHSLDYSLLRFPDQFGGTHFDPDIPTGENLENTHRKFFNLGAGLMFNFRPSNLFSYTLGFAAYNLNRPDISWFGSNSVHLPVRSLIHAMALLQVSKSFDVVPLAKFQWQRRQQQYQFGGMGIAYLNNPSIYKTMFGLFYRAHDHDAIVLALGFNYRGFDIMFNYDANISQLQTASHTIGAFEITLTHVMLKQNNNGRRPNANMRRAVRCPGHI